jgi:hypothetical protein
MKAWISFNNPADATKWRWRLAGFKQCADSKMANPRLPLPAALASAGKQFINGGGLTTELVPRGLNVAPGPDALLS